MAASAEDIYKEIARLLAEGEVASLCTVVGSTGSTPAKDGTKMLVRWDGSTLGTIGGGCPEAEVWAAAREVMECDEARRINFRLTSKETGGTMVCGGSVEIFIEPIATPYLYVFGGGHITREVEKVAALCGLAVVVAGDRPHIVNRERYPEAREVIVGPYEQILKDLKLKGRPLVVVATHSIQTDQVVLEWALRSGVPFVGFLASRAKRAVAARHLEQKGLTREQVERIRAPLGLPIGSKSPGEIAVSIVAEIVAFRHGVRPYWPMATGREKELRRESGSPGV